MTFRQFQPVGCYTKVFPSDNIIPLLVARDFIIKQVNLADFWLTEIARQSIPKDGQSLDTVVEIFKIQLVQL